MAVFSFLLDIVCHAAKFTLVFNWAEHLHRLKYRPGFAYLQNLTGGIEVFHQIQSQLTIWYKITRN